jgi:alpha-glucosidase
MMIRSIRKKSLFSLYLISLTSLCYSALAQNPVREIGNIKAVKISGQETSITTDNGYANIVVYSPSVIRVRIDKKPLQPDQSYAVISTPERTNASIKNNTAEIIIQTDSLKAVIQKKPFSIAFYNNDGSVINEDEKGLTTSWVANEATTYKHMQEKERFIGLGEKTGNLDRKGNGYTNWNTDVYGYRTDADPIYSTIPFYIGIHHGLNYGIFLDNTFQSDFNFGASNDRFSSFGARDGEMNYYFIYHTTVKDIIRSYTQLTGRMKLPPLWSLGYQQNRYSYYPDTEVLRIAQTLREKKIPADGITLDIHYMDKYQLFTWDKERFPNPLQMTTKLKEMGFKTTVIVDPGIKIVPGAPAFERGLKADAYVKYVDGKYYSGQVWPGWCYFTDFTSSKGRDFWKKEVKFFPDNGVTGIWNDMNEIATWGQKMPNNVIFDLEGKKGSHLQAHNIYGALMARTSYEGIREAMPDERPFILTRSGYAGMQRYTAIWTGDNRSEEDHMLLGVRLLNSLGLSGVPFTGMDIGGFTGNPTAGLYARWIQAGAFFPYFRNHTTFNSKASEPWSYGEEVTEIAKNYISLRYKLLPYLYSTFYEATQDGMPVVRSLAIDNTHDSLVYEPAFQNQFLFGQSILVAPVESTKEMTKVYLPSGNWYDLYTDKKEAGADEKMIELKLQRLPVYVRESAIIPMQSLVQTTADAPTDTLRVHIYNGTIPNSFVYYEDDGKSFAYEQGNYYKREIRFDPKNKTVSFEKATGKSSSKFKQLLIVLHGFNNSDKFNSNGASLPSSSTKTFMIDDEKKFAPTLELKITNNADAFSIKY